MDFPVPFAFGRVDFLLYEFCNNQSWPVIILGEAPNGKCWRLTEHLIILSKKKGEINWKRQRQSESYEWTDF